jgi:glycosyltransferase involved in cell wall biosynthesis
LKAEKILNEAAPIRYPLSPIREQSRFVSKAMKIAIVVHGRFHAFDLARELIGLGHEVLLLTNYPKRWPEKFGVPAENVRSLVAHGILSRAALALGKATGKEKLWEPFLHQWFGRWAAKTIERNPVDASHCFSGVAEELLSDQAANQKIRSLVRASSHILVQKQILSDEYVRTGLDPIGPSQWMIQRELREYNKADLIITLSKWCRETFLNQGTKEEKVTTILSGNQIAKFKASQEVVLERLRRVKKGSPLRILTTGSVNLRKGIWDALEVFANAPENVEFTWVGEVHPQVRKLLANKKPNCRFHARVPQFELKRFYAEADLFMTLSLEEGYAAVIGQALASGLPILATQHAGVDHIREGENGWVIPIRRPDLALERLRWIQGNRDLFTAIAQNSSENPGVKDWKQTAAKLVAAYEEFLAKKKG